MVVFGEARFVPRICTIAFAFIAFDGDAGKTPRASAMLALANCG